MYTIIRFKIKKEVDTPSARQILKLKGGLIARSYTDIIHFDDEEEEFYMHYFQVSELKLVDAQSFIKDFSIENDLKDIIVML